MITADQFSDQPQSVVVALDSQWHKTFRRQSDDEPVDFEQYTDLRTIREYASAYRAIVHEL